MSKSFSRILIPTALCFVLLQGCLDDLSFEFPKEQINNCESSCFIFQGIVYDPNNSECIPATIDLIYSQGGYPSFPTYYGQIETNKNGFYSVNFNAKNYKNGYGSFVLKATREGYLTNEIDGRLILRDIDSSYFGRPIIADIILLPKATLQFKFGISKPTHLQSLTYAYKYAQTKYEYAPKGENYGIDTLYAHPVAGDQFVYTWVTYRENNQNFTIQDSIYLKKGETKLVQTNIN